MLGPVHYSGIYALKEVMKSSVLSTARFTPGTLWNKKRCHFLARTICGLKKGNSERFTDIFSGKKITLYRQKRTGRYNKIFCNALRKI